MREEKVREVKQTAEEESTRLEDLLSVRTREDKFPRF